MTSEELLGKKCGPRPNALTALEADVLLPLIPGWQRDNQWIARTFGFGNYHETLAFVNAVAYVVHTEDHHPELVVTYNRCIVRFQTHSLNGGAGGLSENDFICAAKFEAIYQQSFT